MDIFEQKDVLDSFRVIVDTREQQTKKAQQRYESFGVPWERATLAYGDYAYNCTLPGGEPLFVPNETLTPRCVVERKMSLDELAGCLGRTRDRFEREFQRATEHGCRIYLLVEDGSWEALLNHRYRSRLHPNAFFASLTAWTVRYQMTVLFCKADTSGRLIKEILYRDLKERLENGEINE